MSQKLIPVEVLQAAIDAYEQVGSNVGKAAELVDCPRPTMQHRLREAKRRGVLPSKGILNPNDPLQMKSQIRRLTEQVKKAEEDRLDHTVIKHKIIQLTHSVSEVEPPVWTRRTDAAHSKPGVPTLFLSDLHWGEVVDGKQINGVNRYDMEIARERLRYVAERSVHLCEIISPKMEYPGMVLALGGDMMCFPPGTYVTMHDGSVKEIERIEVGDKIVGQNGVSSVKNVHVRKSTKRDVLKTLRTCGSFPVSGTDGHVVAVIPRECVETGWNPGGRRKGFVVRDKEGVSMDDVVWKPLANVRPGDYLISRLGCSLKPSRHKRLDGEGHLHERTGASAHLLASYSVRFASGLDVFLDIDKDVLILDDALGYRVKTIYTEHYKGDLYDLTIDGHPSYHANGYLVHNSGNIHEELVATNQQNMMPTLLDLFETMCSVIQFLRERFGRLFIPCVGGNHSRITHKTWAKDRNYTSFDWLLYCFLAKRFSDDKNITFLIPDGSDAHYKVYDHVFLLTHGDQFRGGDGVIGCLGPIIRGDVRKRSRNMQINMEYDTLLMGHWHQYIQLQRLIVNGSTKGYDEYAYVSNFPFEQPQQALWINHPKYKITYRMPVLADKMRDSKTTAWVSVMK